MILVPAIVLAAAAVWSPDHGCASKVCSVDEIADHVVDWDDRVVLVGGWLRGCHGGFACSLEGAAQRDDSVSHDHLTNDFIPSREKELGDLDGAEVILRVRITDECSGDNICVDRGPQLIPISVEKVISRRNSPQRES